ncbi:MAG: glycerophosphodiester phosphodiesterase family protein [Gammaproteobacteria bacterium]|nr:glycerophosphodiester phosphodiesterase family protein [Gammaproteobacteria bacterium]MDH3769040.1 glycerophosphodiester phosphodiesterase family protein [Gammaproteobacteria bacterium]
MDEHRVMQGLPDTAPVVVAHRGDATHFPENTISALRGAVACGVQHLEFDVQLTADRVPVLLHDESLLRTAGIDQIITASIAAELSRVGVGQADRFGDSFHREYLPSLSDALAALSGQSLTLFVELKRHSLRAFGRRRMLDAVLPILHGGQHNFVIVSFDWRVLQYVRECSDFPIGFVLDAHDARAITQIVQLSPQYVFCNERRLPPADVPLWWGNWDWVIYEITRADQARQLARRGATYVESMEACRLERELRP